MSDNYFMILEVGEHVGKFLLGRSEKMSESKKCQKNWICLVTRGNGHLFTC